MATCTCISRITGVMYVLNFKLSMYIVCGFVDSHGVSCAPLHKQLKLILLIWQIFFPTEPTLSVANLSGIIERITSDEKRRDVWKHILSSESIVDDMYMKYATSKERAEALADIYINIMPGSSWQHVVRVLYAKDELAATKEAKSFLPQNGG